MQSKKILFVTALSCEAQPIVEYFKLKKIEKNFFGNDEFFVFMGGVGAKLAQNLEQLLNKIIFDKIINLGVAGANDKSAQIGELFCVNHEINGIKSAILQTVSEPKMTENLCGDLTLFDMEGKYFLQTTMRYIEGENVFIFKVVSDHLQSERLDKKFISDLIKPKIRKIVESL